MRKNPEKSVFFPISLLTECLSLPFYYHPAHEIPHPSTYDNFHFVHYPIHITFKHCSMLPLIDKPIRFPLIRYVKTLDYYDLPEVNAINNRLYQDKKQSWHRPRLIIYPKDVQMILGRSDQFARQLLLAIRRSLRLTHREPVTIRSFLRYTKLDAATLLVFMIES